MANQAKITYSGMSLMWALVKAQGSPTEPKNIGWGTPSTAVTASANPNVNLFTPQTESRVAGTSTFISTAQLADTYQVTGTITNLNAGKTITEAGLFDTITLSPTTTIATSSQTSGATTITLAANTGLPGSGNYYLQVENETQLVTGGQGTNTQTVTRGVLGSSAAAHQTGVSVTLGGDGLAHTNASLGSQTGTVGAAQGGNMLAHADFAGIALNVNDSIAFTWSIQTTS